MDCQDIWSFGNPLHFVAICLSKFEYFVKKQTIHVFSAEKYSLLRKSHIQRKLNKSLR